MRRLKQVEGQNASCATLWRSSLDKDMPQDFIRRKLWGVSIRRTCPVLQVDTSTYHHKARRPGQAVLDKRIKEICRTCGRYGYRDVHVLPRCERWSLNRKKNRRGYREMGLQLRNETPKRAQSQADAAERGVDMDFVHDQLYRSVRSVC
jgi:putative transposase